MPKTNTSFADKLSKLKLTFLKQKTIIVKSPDEFKNALKINSNSKLKVQGTILTIHSNKKFEKTIIHLGPLDMEFTKNTLSDLDYVSKYLFEEYESMVVKCNVKHTPIPSEIKVGDRINIEKCSHPFIVAPFQDQNIFTSHFSADYQDIVVVNK